MAEPETVYDAGDRAQVKVRENKAQRIQRQHDEALIAVLSTAAGQHFVWSLLAQCGIHTDSFNSNALVMARAAGMQAIGHFITREIARVCPEKYLEMQLLNAKEEANG